VVKGLQEPDVRQRLTRDAIDPQPYDPAAFAAFYRADNEKWGRLAKDVIGVEK
jgi:tripartite-type tricarboxylate transporter receptor subunit TctC